MYTFNIMHNPYSFLSIPQYIYVLHIDRTLHVVKNHTVCIMWCTRSPLTFFPFFTIHPTRRRRRNRQTRVHTTHYTLHTQNIKTTTESHNRMVMMVWWMEKMKWNEENTHRSSSSLYFCCVILYISFALKVKSKQKRELFCEREANITLFSSLSFS